MPIETGTFVFVVCGADEHLTTLNVALRHLGTFSRSRVLVLTDLTRNSKAIEHDEVIDVRTPGHLSHHQASIYLKTGIHRFVPQGGMYCYLDTDVLAVSADCDQIFNEFIPPITFAPDHCRLPDFSAHAVHCGCLARWEQHGQTLTDALERHDRNRRINDVRILSLAAELRSELAWVTRSLPRKALTALRYMASPRRFKLNGKFIFDKRDRIWKLHSGENVLYEVNVRQIEKETGFIYDRWAQKWSTREGEHIWSNECDHLRAAIRNKFGIDVSQKDWQHWNGGVFLFNEQSHAFLESWHRKTLEAFSDSYWRTRDQGTLVATVWGSGLQHHQTLDRKWNFLADYNNPLLQLDHASGSLTVDGWKTATVPVLAHVYHHFGDREWPIWNWVAERLPDHAERTLTEKDRDPS
jgi:hypothetical protein